MRSCPVCFTSMQIDREFYSCPCGCRVHASLFDRAASDRRTVPTKASTTALVKERVFVALSFLDELADEGLIVDPSIRRKIAELAETTVADHWAEPLSNGDPAIEIEDSPF